MVYGTRQAFNTDAIRGVNIDNMGDDKFIVCWTDDAGTVENPECKVGTVSGTTITYGAEAVIDTVDVNFDFDVCSLDANTAVVTYIDSSGDDVWARLATTTGTTINLGIASQTIDTTTAGVIANTCVDADTFVVLYDGSTISPTTIACDVNANDTFTCGEPTTFTTSSNNLQGNDCTNVANNKFVCQWEDITDNALEMIAGTVSGTTITLGNVFVAFTELSSLDTDQGKGLATLGPNQFIGVFEDSSVLKAILGETATSTDIVFGTPKIAIAGAPANSESVVGLTATEALALTYNGTSGNIESNKLTLDFSTLDITATSTPETIDTGTGDANSTDGALISTHKVVIGFADMTDLNYGFAVVGDCQGCLAPVVFDTTPSRKMRLFEGFTIKFISGRIIIYQQ